MGGRPKDEIRGTVDHLLDVVGLRDFKEKAIYELSGGMQQRVALARCLANDPDVILMDEPLGALDAEFRERMAEELRALHDRMGATTVYVTHDQLEAMQMGDKIVVMNHGVVEQFGTPQDIYDKPASLFVADFIGSPPMNFLKFHGSVGPGTANVSLHHHDLPVPQMREPFEGDMVYGVRPEHIRLDDAADYRGEVLATEYLGTTQIVTLATQNGEVKARINADQPARPGETVGLTFNGATVTLFDNQTGRALRSDLNEGVLSHG
jgi:multiple sugar transport system ATP-binding protein